MQEIFQDLNLELSDYQKNQFNDYFEFLVKYNEITNLTAITGREEVYVKHFYDSLSLIKAIDFSEIRSICDVGSGAGFPSIPLKIVFPHLQVSIVDSLGKRIDFLKQLAILLKIKEVSLFNQRAEDFAKEHRESFDLVTARAVAKENILNELCLPLVKKDGTFISMKSEYYENELNEAGNSLKVLGGKIHKIVTFSLPKDYGKRTLIIIKKDKSTDVKYPRNFSLIKKHPL